MLKQSRLYWIIVCVGILFSGCTATEYVATSDVSPQFGGVYHKVKKGETLWRIAKTYQVNINQIIRSNNIPNGAHLEENQLVFIPGVTSVVEINLTQDNNKNEFIWPIRGKLLFYFGEQRGGRFSNGIGIKSYEGEVVRAAREGQVVFADYLSGYAQTVIIDHFDGYFSVYSQNSALMTKLGAHVQKGDSISRVGKNGGLAFLHFEIRKNSRADNPLYYLP